MTLNDTRRVKKRNCGHRATLTHLGANELDDQSGMLDRHFYVWHLPTASPERLEVFGMDASALADGVVCEPL
jgi:hypothetical protein